MPKLCKQPISYYGGKSNLLSSILPLIPKHKIYAEPFFGGGSVFFAKEPAESEIINDQHAMVANFYRVAQTNFAKLKQKVEETLFNRASFSVAQAVWKLPHLFSKVTQAWAFYIGCNMGFSSQPGSWGYDRFGKCNQKFRNKKVSFDSSIVERLENTTIECNDACKVIETFDSPETFIYADPPYPGTHQGHYRGYDQDDFAGLLQRLSKIQGKFLLSSYPNKTLDEYIASEGWHSIEIQKTITASKIRKGETRNKQKIEVLTANYPINQNGA